MPRSLGYNRSLEYIRSLTKIETVLGEPKAQSWTRRWLDVLKAASDEGFHPEAPPCGFGDPTTYAIFEKAVEKLFVSGAVRHGAECFNFYFPQELDPEFLVIWEGFDKVPWKYLNASKLQAFLHERCADGFSFPLNLKWVLCDPGWYELFLALRASDAAKPSLDAWFPPSSGLLDRVAAIRAAHPGGFVPTETVVSTVSAEEAWDQASLELKKYQALQRAKIKLKIALALRRTTKKKNRDKEAGV